MIVRKLEEKGYVTSQKFAFITKNTVHAKRNHWRRNDGKGGTPACNKPTR